MTWYVILHKFDDFGLVAMLGTFLVFGEALDFLFVLFKKGNMKIFIIVLAVIAVICAVIEIISRVIGRREKARFDKMSPEEHRKYQEYMYKRQQMG